MGLGGTARKLQKVVDVADELYAKVNDLREELMTVRDRIDETNDRVSKVETELAEQRILLERLAEAEGVDTNVEGVESTGGEVDDESESESEETAGEATGEQA